MRIHRFEYEHEFPPLCRSYPAAIHGSCCNVEGYTGKCGTYIEQSWCCSYMDAQQEHSHRDDLYDMTTHCDDPGISALHSRPPHPPDTPSVDINYETKSIELRDMHKSSDGISKLEECVTPSVSQNDPRMLRRKTNIHFAAMCWSLFMAGWNDGTTGPLLPRIQDVYHVRIRLRGIQ